MAAGGKAQEDGKEGRSERVQVQGESDLAEKQKQQQKKEQKQKKETSSDRTVQRTEEEQRELNEFMRNMPVYWDHTLHPAYNLAIERIVVEREARKKEERANRDKEEKRLRELRTKLIMDGRIDLVPSMRLF